MTAASAGATTQAADDANLAIFAATAAAAIGGAVLLEAALVPGLVLGAAALIFAPKLVNRAVPKFRDGLQSLTAWTAAPKAPAAQEEAEGIAGLLPRLKIGQALAKTITFRITIASLDFAWNYIFLGDLATAAGLSALSITVGPFFYFLHEAGWNFYNPLEDGATGAETGPLLSIGDYKLTRALAKTIVYETLGTISEFSVNWLVVGDFTTAVIITAPFALFSPFVYLGHEKAWDYFTERAKRKDLKVLATA